VIDLHCHVLAGIDDGPETISGSAQLARASADAGVRIIVATPHVSPRYPNEAATISAAIDELRTHLAREQVAIEIRPGAEIAMTRIAELGPDELPRLGLAGGPWLLIEPPFSTVAANLDVMLIDLQRQGHRILLAHPERCAAFHHNPRMLESAVAAGVLTSVTSGSLVGRFGSRVHRFVIELARAEMIHNVASDAHNCTSRPPSIAAELKQAGLDPLAEWLTEEVPAAILGGRGEIPPRPTIAVPAKPSRRKWWPRTRPRPRRS
jgi:protein-tyrosine phosphatase